MSAEQGLRNVPEVEDKPPFIELGDAVKLGVLVLGTAIGLGIAHYAEKKQAALLGET